MPESNSSEKSSPITSLLSEWRLGSQEAGNRLIELVYRELHGIASRQMNRESSEHTLQTTALVHETYLRLCGGEPINWQDRRHFFAVASQQMRRILVDYARRAKSDKRGGGQKELPLQDWDGAWQIDERLLAVDEALSRLEALDERAAKVVELRFFGGLSESETADALDISLATLKRDWDFARTWLTSQFNRR